MMRIVLASVLVLGMAGPAAGQNFGDMASALAGDCGPRLLVVTIIDGSARMAEGGRRSQPDTGRSGYRALQLYAHRHDQRRRGSGGRAHRDQPIQQSRRAGDLRAVLREGNRTRNLRSAGRLRGRHQQRAVSNGKS